MRTLTIIAGLAVCVLIAGAASPAFAARTVSVECFSPQIVAERPAGPVTLPASGWSDRFRMTLDNRGQFSVQCLRLLTTGGGLQIPNPTVETKKVNCGNHVNLVRARRGRNSMLEFECIARDHRR